MATAMVAWLWFVTPCERSREENIFDSERESVKRRIKEIKKEVGTVSIVFLSEILTEIIFSLPP